MSHRSPSFVVIHVVWATLHRRALLEPSRDGELFAMLRLECARAGSTLVTAGCADDHVHAVLRLDTTVSLASVVKQMKGASSHRAKRAGSPWPLAWQAGYWAESVSPADLCRLVGYVRAQREHHDWADPTESWVLGEPGC